MTFPVCCMNLSSREKDLALTWNAESSDMKRRSRSLKFLFPWWPLSMAFQGTRGLSDGWTRELVCWTRRGILPSLLFGGNWGESHMSTKDMGDILRSFVERFAPDFRDVRFTAHSLKATALSWCAKFGIELGIRRLLGSHKKKGDKSALNYSRDALSAPLRDLDRVMAAIRCGAFRPDLGRSGMLGGKSLGTVSSLLAADHVAENVSVVDADDETKPLTPVAKLTGTRNRFMPAALRGQNHVTTSGDRICYDYNLAHGCNLANAGAQCPKGMHVCTKCYGAHGSVSTHGAASPVASY